jgi:hypothetical protein
VGLPGGAAAAAACLVAPDHLGDHLVKQSGLGAFASVSDGLAEERHQPATGP